MHLQTVARFCVEVDDMHNYIHTVGKYSFKKVDDGQAVNRKTVTSMILILFQIQMTDYM